MQKTRLEHLAEQLRPQLSVMESQQRLPALLQVGTVLLMLPWVLGGVAWLIIVTDYSTLDDHLMIYIALFAALLLTRRQQFTIYFEMGGGSAPMNNSLASMVLWAALLIYGANVLWVGMFTWILWAMWRAWRASRFNQHPLWDALPNLVQDIGFTLVAAMVGLWVYHFLDGVHPFASTQGREWGAPLAAVAVDAIISGLGAMWLVVELNRLAHFQTRVLDITPLFLLVILLLLIMDVFAILGSLVYARGGEGVFLFFVLAAMLVNWLAHSMSRTNDKSQQHARELARLEALGQALLQGSPDGTDLEKVLQSHVGRMFPHDTLEIRLYEHARDGSLLANQLIAPFRLFFSDRSFGLPEELWQKTRHNAEDHTIHRGVRVPQTRAVFGDAVSVKIVAAQPGQTAGQEDVGCVTLLRHHALGKATDSLAAVQSLAAQIGAALYRAEVYVETLAHEKVQQELVMAGRIQHSFLPKSLPIIPGWQLVAALEPARQTSGDFYDLIALPEGRWGIVVADVADKGTGAALFMALSRTLIRTYALEYADQPAQVMASANARILQDTYGDQFVTVFYAVLDPAGGTLTYANAGHNPAFLVGDSSPVALKRTGIPLGMMESSKWRQEQVEVSPGTLLVLYTDGVTEAQNGDQELFGESRLLEIVGMHGSQTAAEMQQTLVQAIQRFAGDAPQADDITLMLLAREKS